MVRLYSDVVANEPREWTVFENEHRNRSKTKSKFNGRSTLFKREDKIIFWKPLTVCSGSSDFFLPVLFQLLHFPFSGTSCRSPASLLAPYGTPILQEVVQTTFTWWIKYEIWFKYICINMVSGGSRIFPRGCANSQKCYYFSIFLPKTAWKWKNLDPGGARVPGAP